MLTGHSSLNDVTGRSIPCRFTIAANACLGLHPLVDAPASGTRIVAALFDIPN
jgi:hypothetical protein